MSAVDQSAVARVVGIATTFKNLRGGTVLLPQRIAVIGQGASAAVYSNDKFQGTSASQIGLKYGWGSPLHLAALQLLPANGDGVGTIPVTFYPLDDDGAGVVATGDITPSTTQTVQASYNVVVNNVVSEPFVISIGDSVADVVAAMVVAINATLAMPVIAADGTTKVDLTSKWQGASANDIVVEITGSTTAGTTYVITQPTGGLNNPDVQDALDLVGGVWETMILNCMEIADTAALTAYNTFGEGRWGALQRKPLVVFTGTTEATVATAIVIPTARKTEKINSQLVEPSGNDLPLVVAARQLARIAKVANDKPANDYGGQKATGLVPAADGLQWDQTERDQAVKGGSSTIEVIDGVIEVSDTVTFYHPTGEEPPAYRYVKDIVKLQQVLFNLDLIFASADWNGKPLVPNDQFITNPEAKKPKMAVADVAKMLRSLGADAIISDPETAILTIVAEIDSQNPNRLNVTFTIQLSGNTNIISVDLNFGFYFGTVAEVA